MRIVPALENFQFNPNPQEIQPLIDIYRIFGGGLMYYRKPLGFDTLTYTTEDQRVSGSSRPVSGVNSERSSTTIQVRELGLHTQAARWTVVHAYKTKYYEQYETDSSLRTLPFGVVIPDQPAMQEPVAPDESTPLVYKMLDLNSNNEILAIQAREKDLLSAARTIAAYYSEQLPVSELDSSIAVAYALGATSINQLEDAWREAMAQPDPYAAAVAASRILLHEL